jgi:hypothetical protein
VGGVAPKTKDACGSRPSYHVKYDFFFFLSYMRANDSMSRED